MPHVFLIVNSFLMLCLFLNELSRQNFRFEALKIGKKCFVWIVMKKKPPSLSKRRFSDFLLIIGSFVFSEHVLDAVGSHTAIDLVTDFDDGGKTAGTDATEAGQ